MSERSHKTNAMRLLESRGIPYRPHHFSPDIHSAEGVAETVGMPPAQVFKTLVVLPATAGKPLLAVVPGDRELDLKALARAAAEKKLRMASQREAESLTGLLVGGISALALLDRPFRVFLDDSAARWETILVSAGERGVNVEVAPGDLARLTRARSAPLSRASA